MVSPKDVFIARRRLAHLLRLSPILRSHVFGVFFLLVYGYNVEERKKEPGKRHTSGRVRGERSTSWQSIFFPLVEDGEARRKSVSPAMGP